jgi:hypothetical protein
MNYVHVEGRYFSGPSVFLQSLHILNCLPH